MNVWSHSISWHYEDKTVLEIEHNYFHVVIFLFVCALWQYGQQIYGCDIIKQTVRLPEYLPEYLFCHHIWNNELYKFIVIDGLFGTMSWLMWFVILLCPLTKILLMDGILKCFIIFSVLYSAFWLFHSSSAKMGYN